MPITTHPLLHLLIFMGFWLILIVFLVCNLDEIVTSVNKMNRNATVLFIFCLGVSSAFIGVMLLAYFPNVDHDAGKAAAGLGASIVTAAAMAFRGGADDAGNQRQPPSPPQPGMDNK